MNRQGVLGLTALCLLWQVPARSQSPPATTLDPGNALYQQRDYAGARRAYEALLASQGPRVNLLYNLGNACLEGGDTGWAVVYYERALLAAPRDADLRANLGAALAARRTAGGGEVPGWSTVLVRALQRRFTLNELAGAASALYLLAAALAWWWLREGALRRRLRWVLYLALALALGVGGLAVGKARIHHDPARVVVVADTELLSGPADSFPALRKAYEGEMGRVTQRQGVWVETKLESGARGWVTQSALAPLMPAPRG